MTPEFSADPDGAPNFSGTEIRLDIHPMKMPNAVFIRLSDQGVSDSFEYSPAALTVVATRHAKVNSALRSQLLAGILKPEFQAALEPSNYSGDGLRQGDQFTLLIKTQSGTDRRLFGFIEQAPLTIQTFIKDLLALQQNWKSVAPAEAYAHCETVERQRFEMLLHEGRVSIVSLRTLSSDLQALIVRITQRPYDFVAIKSSQQRRLLDLCTKGQPLFTENAGIYSQLFVFQLRNTSPPRR